jgi:glycine cleavage system H lipoate-binding protein
VLTVKFGLIFAQANFVNMDISGGFTMVIILVAFVFLLFIAISWLREKKAATSPVSQAAMQEQPVYIHPSHTFARLAADGEIEVGMDEFAQRALGEIKVEDLPQVGQHVHQGEKAWRVRVGYRSLVQRIPVDGIVTAINSTGSNWLLKIKTDRWSENMANLIQGASISQWLKSVRSKLLLNHAGELAPSMQDGGELVQGFARHFDDAQWQAFCKDFFNCESNIHLDVLA